MTVHSQTLVDMENSGCVAMLRDERIDDLRRMYDLFTRVPHTLECLREAVCEHVKRTGRELVSDQERIKDPVEFVKGLLQMRDKYDRVVSDAFRAEKKAQKKLKEAFEDFINADSRCASYLVLYIHELLQSSLKAYSEEDADRELDKVIVIFRYLQDKDIFENFYKQHLAKRLLSGRSISDEAERNMIAKLKTECGYQFTSKLEGMFTDMRISKDTMEQYKRTRVLTRSASSSRAEGEGDDAAAAHRMAAAPAPPGGPELEVNVLTTGYWPTTPVPPCALPVEVKRCCDAFGTFYLSKHTGRKLTWQTNMGGADLKARFGENWHELSVSTYQMCILMLFNTSDTLSLDEIQERTSIPEPDLKRHLISLCTPRHKVLKKQSKGKLIVEGDSFSFNPEFSSKFKRVKVPLVSLKETEGPKGGWIRTRCPHTLRRTAATSSRRAIVRIMKARKALQHNDLIAEVTRQLSSRFVPVPANVKKRIESLIEREYLERDRSDRRLYKYLA